MHNVRGYVNSSINWSNKVKTIRTWFFKLLQCTFIDNLLSSVNNLIRTGRLHINLSYCIATIFILLLNLKLNSRTASFLLFCLSSVDTIFEDIHVHLNMLFVQTILNLNKDSFSSFVNCTHCKVILTFLHI